MRGWIITGAVMADISILLGIFGAHGLKNEITAYYIGGLRTDDP